jgi:prepilin-type N-terminal cleavage/methylation domain-containing protein
MACKWGVMTVVSAGPARNEAGFTLIDMLFVVAIIGLLATLAIPGLMRARGAAQSSSALGTMRVVNSAQLSFAITCGLGFYSPDFPTLTVPPPGGGDAFLSPELANGPTFIKGGYEFSLAGTPMAGAPGSCNGLGPGQTSPSYAAVADQMDVLAQGRFFGTNADGIIYEHTASLAGTMPETGAPPGGAPIK